MASRPSTLHLAPHCVKGLYHSLPLWSALSQNVGRCRMGFEDSYERGTFRTSWGQSIAMSKRSVANTLDLRLVLMIQRDNDFWTPNGLLLKTVRTDCSRKPFQIQIWQSSDALNAPHLLTNFTTVVGTSFIHLSLFFCFVFVWRLKRFSRIAFVPTNLPFKYMRSSIQTHKSVAFCGDVVNK